MNRMTIQNKFNRVLTKFLEFEQKESVGGNVVSFTLSTPWDNSIDLTGICYFSATRGCDAHGENKLFIGSPNPF